MSMKSYIPLAAALSSLAFGEQLMGLPPGLGSRFRNFHFNGFGRLVQRDAAVFTCNTTSEERARIRFGAWQRKQLEK
jgi:hypothetical protein